MTSVVRITVSKARGQRVRAQLIDADGKVHAEELACVTATECMLPEFVVHSGMRVVVDELPEEKPKRGK